MYEHVYPAQVRRQLREACAQAQFWRQVAEATTDQLAAATCQLQYAQQAHQATIVQARRQAGRADAAEAQVAELESVKRLDIHEQWRLATLLTVEDLVHAVQQLHCPDHRGDCAHCSSHGKYAHVPWPCPTVIAAGIPERPARCQRCRGLGKVPDWGNWDRVHGEPKPKPCPECPGEWPHAYPEWQVLLKQHSSIRCCVCGTTEHGGRTWYENYRRQLFCIPCADGNRPSCPLGDACDGVNCAQRGAHGPRTDAGSPS